MDNPWYDYSPFPKRPKLAWPKNARVAFCVVLTLEYYELEPAEDAVKDSRFVGEFGNYRPDYRTWTQRDTATAPASSACSTCSTVTRSAPASPSTRWRPSAIPS
jgi:hypothetical protein